MSVESLLEHAVAYYLANVEAGGVAARVVDLSPPADPDPRPDEPGGPARRRFGPLG